MPDARGGRVERLFVFEMGAVRKKVTVGVVSSERRHIMPIPASVAMSTRPRKEREEADLESAVPASGAQCHTIGTDTQTTDSVFVPGQHADALSVEGVPDVASPIVVTAKEDAARKGEGNGGDTAQDVVVGESVQFAICANVE
jgi:hypothetical protein